MNPVSRHAPWQSRLVLAAMLAALAVPGSALGQGIVDGFGRGLGEGIGRGLGEILREGVRPPPPASDPGPASPRSDPAPGPAAPPLARAEVVELQRHLIALGYLRDVADGIAGRNTHQAIRDFQRSRGLPVDGCPTAAVLQATRQAVAVASPPASAAPAARPASPTPTPTPTPVAPAPTLRVQPAPGAPAAALMLRPHEEARPGERGDDPALRTLARAVLTAEPSLLDDPDVLLAAARHLTDQRTQTYLRGGVWAGAGQAERARRELPALLAADSPGFPLTALWITPLSVMAHYDETPGGLRIINPHQWRLAVERALDPIYSLRTTIGLDRGAPTVLPAADRAAATALFANLPSRAPPGIGRADQARTVFLKTLVRFDPPQTVEGPRLQRWVHLRGTVLDQAIYADPALTTRLVDRAALDPTRREAPLVAGFAADPPAPEALPLDAERSADTLALLRLRAGAAFADLALPGLESEAGAWLRAYASEAQHRGFPWPGVVTPQQISGYQGITGIDRRPLEAAFMAWNARRLAALPETLLHRHRAAIAPPFTEAKRLSPIAESLRADRPEARSPARPGAPPPGTLFRFAPGTPDALEIDAALMARLGRGPAEVETRLRIVDAAMEDGVAIVTVAVVSATARIADAVVARLGAAPAVAAPAAGAASRLAVLGLRPGASAEDARAALDRHFGEDRVVARLLGRTMVANESMPGMPRRGLMMARPDDSDRVAVFATETGGPAVAILRSLAPAQPVPLADALSGLEALYGPPDLRRDEQPVRTAAGMRPSLVALGWSEGSARPELAAIARERAACVGLFDDAREEVWWWREDAPRFGLVRGMRGPAGPRWWADRQREVDCGTTLRVALEVEAETGRVTRITALVADPRVLRTIVLDATDREAVGTIGTLAEGMPDVVGITVGMAWDEALRVAEAHLGEALRVAFASAPTLDPEGRREFETGTILVRRDLMEAIGLYREPPGAADRVVAVTRRLLVPVGQVDPPRIAAALIGKYGEPDRRSGGLFHWGITGEDDVVCGETQIGGFPVAADRSALPQQTEAGTVLEALPTPRLAGTLDGLRRLDPPTLLARDAVLLACPPVIGARIAPSLRGDLIEIDQWALDIGGYLGLLDAARDAATRPAAPSGGPAAASVPFRL